MRRAILLTALAAIACGGGPTTPSMPPAPVYPNMLGGWSGTWVETYTTNLGSGTITCNETWVVDAQNPAGVFSGTYQNSGEDQACTLAGLLDGNVFVGGEARIQLHSSASPCALLSGDPTFSGFVSSAGALTTQQTIDVRCTGGVYDAGIDYHLITVLSLNRR